MNRYFALFAFFTLVCAVRTRLHESKSEVKCTKIMARYLCKEGSTPLGQDKMCIKKLCADFSLDACCTVANTFPDEGETNAPTEPSTTEAPTEPPTTEAPTEAPTTEAPTQAPTTEAPTDAPTTEAPTEPPTTEAPTELSTTSAPTEPPTTDAPTEPPTTEALSQEPEESTTEAPTEPPMTEVATEEIIMEAAESTTRMPTEPPSTEVPIWIPREDIRSYVHTYRTYDSGANRNQRRRGDVEEQTIEPKEGLKEASGDASNVLYSAEQTDEDVVEAN